MAVPRTSDAQLASFRRVNAVRTRLTETLGELGREHKDLTYDEALEALLDVARDVVQDYRAGRPGQVRDV
jgi:hypothetical protein